MNIRKIISTFAMLLMAAGLAYADGNLPTKFTNQGGISNTRHNLTQRPPGSTMNASMMDPYRNDYGEVCVYCHTPHGANTNVNLPLWNRTMKATTYTTYNQLGTSTLTQAVAQPGVNSLACLSCHDGQTAIDSIINMPGSGRYQANQATGSDPVFLSTWINASTGQKASSHRTLNADAGSTSCLACHSAASVAGDLATDFSMFAIGTDLKNDHPVGVTFPAVNGSGSDFKTPAGRSGPTFFFDKDGDGHMDGEEVRLYDNGGAAKVECASCHDPHGIPTGAAGSALKPTFLRVENANSALCLTCHTK